MSRDYDNTDRGALFKNQDKEKDTHPDYKGTINVGGVEYWLSAWLKESQKGVKYMSLSVKAKEERQSRRRDEPPGRRNERQASRQEELNDDIPW